jgi:hypothetical protein
MNSPWDSRSGVGDTKVRRAIEKLQGRNSLPKAPKPPRLLEYSLKVDISMASVLGALSTVWRDDLLQSVLPFWSAPSTCSVSVHASPFTH